MTDKLFCDASSAAYTADFAVSDKMGIALAAANAYLAAHKAEKNTNARKECLTYAMARARHYIYRAGMIAGQYNRSPIGGGKS